MTITGRLTADAVVNTLKDERQVVNFSVAINDTFRKKGERERQKETTYCSCAYWISTKVAQHLKKATLVELTVRIFVTPYVSKNGEPRASLNCHVNDIKILAWPKEATVTGKVVPCDEHADVSKEKPF